MLGKVVCSTLRVVSGVAMAGATWLAVNHVAEGSPYINAWARKGFMDGLELVMKCVVESEH